MSTVISLCHFCEQHGPVVLFCTQVTGNSSNKEFIDDSDDISTITTSNSDVQCPSFHAESMCFKKCPNIVRSQMKSVSVCCEACHAFTNTTSGYISREHGSPNLYITKHCPNILMNSIVNQACVKSFSCEHCPGQSGPLFYGDDSGFNTFCYKFFLKDFHSRGFKRSYCINFQAEDKIYLLNSWKFLVKNIELIVNKLKQEAENKFNTEHAEHGNVLRCKSPTSASSTSSLTSSSISCLHQKQSCQNELTSSKQTRALIDITGNQDVFKELHLMFVWLLKAYRERFISLELNEPLHKNISNENENIIDLNRQEETEEGFVKLFTCKNPDASETMGSSDKKDDCKLNNDDDVAVFTHARDLLQVLGLPMFSELLHHSLIGHQLVIRAKDRPIIKSVIDCLVKFLPDKLAKISYHTIDYEGNSDHHFIGMPLLPLPPPSIRPYVLLDISGIHALKKISKLDRCSIAKHNEDCKMRIEELMLRYYMLTTEKLYLSGKPPTMLENILRMLMNESLDNAVVDLCLLSIKEDWLNKSSMYQLHLCTGEQKSRLDESRFLQIINAKDEDKVLLKFWATAI